MGFFGYSKIMTKPKPLTDWQSLVTPKELPRHIRRNIGPGDGGCWLWLRSKSDDGYGWASLGNKTYQAHRLVFTILRHPPPDGLVLDHLCRVRHCVNPEHLQPVTNHINLFRSELTPAGAKRCQKGHLFIHTGRQRRCPVCLAEYEASRRAEKAAYMRDLRRRRAA